MKTCRLAGFLFAICLILVSPTVHAGQSQYAPSVERWGMQEIVLHSTRHYDNPFKDVNLSAAFDCADEHVNAAGFYDGDSNWKIRFMPERIGHCSFKTTSNNPELNQHSGAFEVTAPRGTGDGPQVEDHISGWHWSFCGSMTAPV